MQIVIGKDNDWKNRRRMNNNHTFPTNLKLLSVIYTVILIPGNLTTLKYVASYQHVLMYCSRNEIQIFIAR